MSDEGETQVGIVVVSHSARAAEGTAEIAAQMAPGVRLLPVGGLPDGDLGTDTVQVMEAIQHADSGAGVVVLADVGSTIIGVKAALELLEGVDPELRGRVRLSRGPLVEGALFAAVQASVGDALEGVLATADAASTVPKDVD